MGGWWEKKIDGEALDCWIWRQVIIFNCSFINVINAARQIVSFPAAIIITRLIGFSNINWICKYKTCFIVNKTILYYILKVTRICNCRWILEINKFHAQQSFIKLKFTCPSLFIIMKNSLVNRTMTRGMTM